MTNLSGRRREENGNNAALALCYVERMQRGEAHRAWKLNDLTHGRHLAMTAMPEETMKCRGFQGDA